MTTTAKTKPPAAALSCPVCATPVPTPGHCKAQCRREDERYLDHLKRAVVAVLGEQVHARGLLAGAEQRETEFREEITKVSGRLGTAQS